MTAQNIAEAIAQGYVLGKPKNGTTPFLVKPSRFYKPTDPMCYQPWHIVLEEESVKEFEQVEKVEPLFNLVGLDRDVADYYVLAPTQNQSK